MENSLLHIARKAAVVAGNLLLDNYSVEAGIESNIGKDIKTKADLASNKVICEILRPTGINIVSEELFKDHSLFDLKQSQWIIDPLDGTLNFSRSFGIASVSVSYWENGKPMLGVLYDLGTQSIWSSSSTDGAFLNGKSIHVSNISTLDQAILTTGIPTGASIDQKFIARFMDNAKCFKKLRMLGCASLMLAQVAAGVFDAYEERDIYIWDIAAGLALISAAGGKYKLEQGMSSVQFHARASNSHLPFC